jgi:hypothetical protein
MLHATCSLAPNPSFQFVLRVVSSLGTSSARGLSHNVASISSIYGLAKSFPWYLFSVFLPTPHARLGFFTLWALAGIIQIVPQLSPAHVFVPRPLHCISAIGHLSLSMIFSNTACLRKPISLTTTAQRLRR